MILIRRFSFNYPCPKKLREIVQLSAFEKENSLTIKSLWKEYHLNKDKNISDVVLKVT